MNWADLEQAFNRAILLTASKKKLVLTFPVLSLCGIFFVFCRAIAFDSGEWVSMSFSFLPILLSSGILLALGVLLIRLHHHEAKKIALDFKKLIIDCIDLIVGISYLSFLPILVYLFLWILLGIFFLLKEMPIVGHSFSVVFSFGPFLLIFGSLLLCLFNMGLLFFVAPVVALQPFKKLSVAKRVLDILNRKCFTALILFLIAQIPLVIVGGLLSLAAVLTDVSFLIAERSLLVALEWFFIMLPFCAILSPAVIFFFNFAAESHQLLQGTAFPTSSIYGDLKKEFSNK
ncbi:MAG TPA: hypothetical protein VLE95_03970 [Chlamydiales bacterium]|nr:hypothetical protein [Chlamydiales bacterium]